ncbi:MAG: hypothetical protein SCJ93_01050 [Bacillota bacterium]|nr:hypothetical protein [Bacillota bacterium]
MNNLDLRIIAIIIFFVILISIQYTLNLILKELKELKSIVKYKRNKD